MTVLGKNLKYQREKRNLTQAQVSTALGLGDKVLSNYERGCREPDCNMLVKLADFYDVTVDQLLKANEDNHIIIEETAIVNSQENQKSQKSFQDELIKWELNMLVIYLFFAYFIVLFFVKGPSCFFVATMALISGPCACVLINSFLSLWNYFSRYFTRKYE